MGNYTEFFIERAENMSPEDDDYEQRLLDIASNFRGFDEACTDFIINHGYEGDVADVSAKAKFLRKKYKENGVRMPHDFREWFEPGRFPERKTVLLVGFAFNLTVEEMNDFLRCVQFDRGLDCHTIRETVYYFCLQKGLGYTQAEEIISKIPKPKKDNVPKEGDILYTNKIVEQVDRFDNSDELIAYVTENLHNFSYNNAAAINNIRTIWKTISKEGGLAEKEGSLLERSAQLFYDLKTTGYKNKRQDEYEAERVKQIKQLRLEEHVHVADDRSVWNIFSQIIGIDVSTQRRFSRQNDRSIKSVLTENALLPLKASYCFPSQSNITKLIRGESKDNEMIRKMLIFLKFYAYWAEVETEENDLDFIATFSDSERCMDEINNYLLSSGYPQLYACNPYDWIFMHSLNDMHPLATFRYYMGEIFTVKSGEDE